MEKLLQVSDLHVSFFTNAGQVKAVNGVSFDLMPGEVLGIVGESGSGKSVTVNSIMRLLAPTARIVGGNINFNGRDVMTLNDTELRRFRGAEVSMIFQDPMTSLNPVYTIGEQITETLKYHTGMNKVQRRQRAIELLDMVGIPNPEYRLKQYPHEFSGGMRQRAMIAIALSCNPKLLIADEPTTALDVTIQAQILELMQELRKKINTAIILITHDLGIVSNICDNIIVMYAGHIVERAQTDDLFYETAHPYTKGLLNCLPSLADDERKPLIPIEGSPVDLLNLPEGCPFISRCKNCMRICVRAYPPTTHLSDTHYSCCWLNHQSHKNHQMTKKEAAI